MRRLTVLLALCTACSDPTPEPVVQGCGGGILGKHAVGTASLTTSLGDLEVTTCGVSQSGCPDNKAGECHALSFSGDNGTYSLIVGAILPKASGTFECTSEQVAVSLSKFDSHNEGVWAGGAFTDGSGPHGSCKITQQTSDADNWVGTIEGSTLVASPPFQGTATFQVSGSIHTD